ncbi:methanol O-anthraniloyltransferase-like [Coffea eugenioides]|uniref:Benzyl alcohol O-benzoyltransferase-like n=1 Tax=Coffea arabica TaxID=13443 RepID=A0A6P6X037_COFAR|nr:methanol O-anthraniloyltransferase-like [Coffea eugenioides]
MAMQFLVRHKEAELIVPAKTTPQEIRPLSDIDDQKGHRFHLPMIMFYSYNQCMDEKNPVGVIRDAVAKALFYYYPYAGRLIEGPSDKILVNCTAEGVVFREAIAEVRLDQLRDFMQPPFPYSKEFLIDASGSTEISDSPLMLIQVTRLSCGGLVLAIRINHTVSDAIGLVQFLNAVSQISKDPSSAPSPLPVWQRWLLSARNPPYVTCVHNEFEVEKNSNSCTEPTTLDSPLNLVRKGFFFGAQEIKAIKKYLPPNIPYASKFDLVTAFVWRSRTIALQLDPEEIVTLTYAVNVRGKNKPKLPSGYYGNGFVSPAAVSKVNQLCNNSFVYALELVKKAKHQVTEGFIKSAIDYSVLHGKPGYSTLLKDWIVSDASRAGIDDVDFGWGKPIYGGTMDGGPTFNMTVYSQFRNNQGDDGLVVPVCLPVAAMENFQKEMEKMIKGPMDECNKFWHPRILSML